MFGKTEISHSLFSQSDLCSAMQGVKSALRPLAHWAREAKLYFDGRAHRTYDKTIVLFPSDIPQMSALLRAYNIADYLNTVGWRAIVVPKQLGLSARRRILARYRPDLIFFQSSRHPLNDPSHYPEYPVVYDIDDADFVDDRLVERIERTCREATVVIAGSRFVADWCRQYNDNVEVIWTGSASENLSRTAQSAREPVITWAQSDPNGYPEEFEFVCRVLKSVRRQSDLPFRLRLYGMTPQSDMSRIKELKNANIETEIYPMMPYQTFIASLTDVVIGLCPLEQRSMFSRGKSFGKILGYLDAKVPVIASDMADHTMFFDDDFGVISDDETVWAATIIALLEDPVRRQDMADRAYTAFVQRLTAEVSAQKVAAALQGALSR